MKRKPRDLSIVGVYAESVSPPHVGIYHRFVYLDAGWITLSEVKRIHRWLGRVIEWKADLDK